MVDRVLKACSLMYCSAEISVVVGASHSESRTDERGSSDQGGGEGARVIWLYTESNTDQEGVRQWSLECKSHGWSSCHCCETSQQQQLKINHLVKKQAVRVSKQSSDEDGSGSHCAITHAATERLRRDDSKPNPREWGSVGAKRETG